ncbi:hypothetical protein O181_070679 [Austropuccinia psidii MF-1]|uniref:Uncharacterized protein n=1 Tax=Austropuccinia psidii MF-1 TaxID=1389203 RepID=A0A9Q3I9R1_9BASI|nr:hypothetical protein [Austropuccinia psidii MF-1]
MENSGKAGRGGGIRTKFRRAGDLEESVAGEKKVEGLLAKDGLLYHGEAEMTAAVAAPDKGSASRCVSKIEAQSQHPTKAQLQGVLAELNLSHST